MSIIRVIPRLEAVKYDGNNGPEIASFWASATMMQEDGSGIWIRTGPALGHAIVVVPVGSFLIRKNSSDQGSGSYIPGGTFAPSYIEIRDDALVTP